MTALTQPSYQSVSEPMPAHRETPSIPPSYGAPGRVLLATGTSPGNVSRALQMAGHETVECQSLKQLCFQLKYSQPDLICIHESAAGSIDQALRIVRGRHSQVPIVLLTSERKPGIGPVRHGYYSALSEPVDGEELMIVAAHAIAHHRMVRRIIHLETETTGDGFGGFVGSTPFAKRLFRKLQSFAAADVHVLFTGPPGSGKSLAARAIHDHSARGRGPFIALNCQKLSDSAFSADAFVNAAMGSPKLRQHGALDDADRGTLYLSNIDALSPNLQVPLLRALGPDSPCDFRLIASTTQNLDQLTSLGVFNSELLSHLSYTRFEMQPLSNRVADVGRIAQAIVDELAQQQSKPRVSLAPETISALEQHPYKRNVAELREILASALVNCGGTTIDPSALPAMVQVPALVGPRFAKAVAAPDSTARRQQVLFEILAQKPMKIREIERCAIEATLQRTNDNVTQAMRELGIGRTTLYRKLKKYGKR